MANDGLECTLYDMCEGMVEDIENVYSLFRNCGEESKCKPGYCSIYHPAMDDEGRTGD